MGEQDVQVIFHSSTKTIIRKKQKMSREGAQNNVSAFVESAQTQKEVFYSNITQKEQVDFVYLGVFADWSGVFLHIFLK